MAKQTIEATDTLNAGRVKINDNFTELYDAPIKSGTLAADVTINCNEKYVSINNSTGVEFFSDNGTYNGFNVTLGDSSLGVRPVAAISAVSSSNNYSTVSIGVQNVGQTENVGIIATHDSGLTFLNVNLNNDATGDIYYRNASGYFTRLPIGSEGQILKVVSGLPAWVNP